MNQDALDNLSAFLAEGSELDAEVLSDLFAMSELVDRIQRRIRDLAEASGMPPLHFFVLEHLALHGGTASLRDLLVELNVPKQSGTYIIDQLEKGGMVERHRDPMDRRRLRVTLTADGEHQMRTHLTPFYAAMTSALSSLPKDERAQVIQGLSRIHRAL